MYTLLSSIPRAKEKKILLESLQQGFQKRFLSSACERPNSSLVPHVKITCLVARGFILNLFTFLHFSVVSDSL